MKHIPTLTGDAAKRFLRLMKESEKKKGTIEVPKQAHLLVKKWKEEKQ